MKKRSLRALLAFALAVVLLSGLSVTAFALGDIFGSEGHIANFIKKLFVPDANYFHNQLASLSQHFIDRFGGIAYLFLLVEDFFTVLQESPTMQLTVDVPRNFLFRGSAGMSINVFQAAEPFIRFLRGALTGGFCVLTAIVCYKKLLGFFRE